MSDETQLRETPPVGGESQSQGDSSQQAGQPLEAEVKELKSEVARLKKLAQSDKDRAASRAETKADSALNQIEVVAKYLKIDPKQVEEAQRQSVLDELVNERLQGRNQPVVQAGGTGAVQQGSSQVNFSDVDSELGLNPNDPRLTQLKLQYKDNQSGYVMAAAKLLVSTQPTSPTPAEMPLPNESVAKTRNPSLDALQKEYETKRGEIMQKNLSQEAKVRALSDLKVEYRGKGLNLN